MAGLGAPAAGIYIYSGFGEYVSFRFPIVGDGVLDVPEFLRTAGDS